MNEEQEHIHVELPSGGVANVSSDCPQSTLNALDEVCRVAKREAIGEAKKAKRAQLKAATKHQDRGRCSYDWGKYHMSNHIKQLEKEYHDLCKEYKRLKS